MSNKPNAVRTLNATAPNLVGSLTKSVTVYPQKSGRLEIPAVQMLVFNPKTERFIRISSTQVAVNVMPALPVAETQGIAQAAPLSSSQSLADDNISWVWKVGSAIALFLVSVGTMLFIQRRKSVSKPSVTMAGSIISDAHSSHTAKSLKQLLFTQIEQIGIATPSVLTRQELQQALHNYHLSATIQQEIFSLLDALDIILYSPTNQADSAQLQQLTIKLQALLQELDVG